MEISVELQEVLEADQARGAIRVFGVAKGYICPLMNTSDAKLQFGSSR